MSISKSSTIVQLNLDRLENQRSDLARQITIWTWVAVILVLTGIASGAWYIYWYLWPVYKAGFPPDSEEMARFGSYLQGATGTLWTLATVLFIYVAFLGQRMQLFVQQEELETTKADVVQQQRRLDEQVATSLKQVFESSFFQLLAAHSRIIDAISVPVSGSKQFGRDCFTFWYGQLKNNCFPTAQKAMPGDNVTPIEPAFNQLYAYWRTDLGHYFRSLYNLIKFVKAAQLNDRRFYTNLVRAQMSDQEVLMLFYNCLTQRGAKFRPLVEEFALLKHLDPKDLCAPDHAKLYNENAYGSVR